MQSRLEEKIKLHQHQLTLRVSFIYTREIRKDVNAVVTYDEGVAKFLVLLFSNPRLHFDSSYKNL